METKPLAIIHGDSLPEGFNSAIALPEILQRAARETTGITYLQIDETEVFQSYGELLERATCLLGGLRALGLKPKDPVILQLSRPQDFLATFWGCLLGGFVPVPIAVAPSYTPDNSKANLVYQAWQLCDCALVVSHRQLIPVIRSFSEELQVVAVEELQSYRPDNNWHTGDSDELALLLLTSGSTGAPKGVMLSDRNLLASAFGMAKVNRLSQKDITLNWMPLEHVASLVMFHITEVYLGCQQIHVPNELVLQNPLKWLDFCDRYRVTATWAPNFAYGLVNERVEAISEQCWDLSCLRWMGNGAEAVVGKTTRRFLKLLAPYGLASTAVSPGYGMSETSSGIVHSHRFSLESTTDDDPFVEVGSPIPGVSLRIVDSENRVVEEGAVGLLQVKGLTVTSGYYKSQERDREIFTEDGWLNTGDLGFLREGRLTITGRQKEVIIINGVNYYNHEIEAVVEAIDGVEVSYTAACAVRKTGDTTDKLVIFFNPSNFLETSLHSLIKTIRKTLVSKIGVYPDYLIPVDREMIPKTAIGKIQRKQLSQRFEAGEFDSIVQQMNALLESRETSELPQSDLERQIAEIWQKVLGIERVSLHDNFFELGGNSLLLMQVLAKLQERLGRQLSAVELFQYPAIATLAQYLSQKQTKINAAQQGQQRAQHRRKSQNTDIAVIGMSCRFPGAKNVDEFWQNLCNGVESISFFTDEEILASGIDPQLLNNPNYVKASPILEDIELFDAEFFGYSPKEAELIDPQQRLLLECAWESLENAGYNPLTYQGAIALYAGASANTYLLNNVYPNRHQIDEHDNLQVINLGSMAGFQMTVANDKDYLTTRVSYKLNLTGASVNVQTACSTSLVAIHMACQSLLAGECDMALAGGVSVHVPQKVGYLYRDGTILSPDGHCRAFAAGAQGTLFGSGAGIVVLKRLEDAIRDRDRIYAVIKGSAINNDGGTKVGYLAPNSDGQAKAIAEAIAISGIDAETISYIEAHGTGTILGDPLEFAALTQAFRTNTQKKGFCAIGSVKTNVGHLNIASGVTGFIKTVLSLYHKKLPASLHFEQPNPQIDFINSPFYVNTTLKEWKTAGVPRRAGVNSLGIGGTNAHVILEEFHVQTIPPASLIKEGGERREKKVERPSHVLTLSARSEKALQELVQRYKAFLESNPEVCLSDLCFTANTGRSHFEHRLCIVTESVEQLRQQLQAYLIGKEISGLVSGQALSSQRPKLAFLFTGQGSQYVGMGRELYQTQPTFRAALDKCAEIVQPYLDKPLLEVLYSDDRRINPKLDETAHTQPALFAIEYALYQLWQSWGISPTAVIGHSVGEYVAACVAGVFSLEDGLKLIAARGRLMQQLPPDGTMVAVFASEARVSTAIAPYQQQVNLAAINGYENLVISGKREAIERIVSQLKAGGIETKPLNVSHAFHSPLMEPILAEFETVARQITYSPPRIELISNLTGEAIGEEIATPEYWCRHIRQPVRYAQSLETLHRLGYQAFVEIGAKPILLGMARSILENPNSNLWLPSLRPGTSDWQQLLESLAQLYVRGVSVDWFGFDRDYSRYRITLPTYSFQRKRYWIEVNPKIIQNPIPSTPQPPFSRGDSQFGQGLIPLVRKGESKIQNQYHPLLGQKLRSPLKEIIFESQLAPDMPAFLKDHRIFQQVILSGTAYLEMALAAGIAALKSTKLVLENVTIQQALILPEEECQTVQLILSQQDTGTSFEIYSLISEGEESWKLHCSGKILVKEPDTQSEQIDLARLRGQFASELSVNTHYDTCRELAIDYGESFQAIARLWKKEGEALGWIRIPETLASEVSIYQFHPVLLDACFQVIFATLPEALKSETYLPVGLERLFLYRHPRATVWSHVRLRPLNSANPETIIADLRLFDDTGNLVAQIDGLSSKRASREALLDISEKSWQDWLYQIEWRSQQRDRDKRRIRDEKSRSWLIFADKEGLAKQLAELLEDKQHACTLVFPGKEYKQSPGKFQINPNNLEDFQQLLNAIARDRPSLYGIIYLWSLDALDIQFLTKSGLEIDVRRGCAGVLHLIQALVKRRDKGTTRQEELPPSSSSTQPNNSPRLWLVTKGAQPVKNSEFSPSGIAQSCLWGMGKAIALEHPELNCVRIDLDPKSTENEIQTLFDEIWSPDVEDQIAFRDGNRYVARLVRNRLNKQSENKAIAPIENSIPVRLEIENRGVLDNLHWQPIPRRHPSADEIEIQVRATGLNFRDVLNALGLYPGDAGLLGLECAGEVVAIGQGVRDFQIGDAVVAIASGSFSQYVTVNAALAVHKPENLGFEEAVTIPGAFSTAYYSLYHLAKISAGDRILIHAAAGGVGLAAIQLAQQAGAEVFATASPSKWDFLESLGVKHIMNSRTLDFAEEVISITQGEGVDIILNSLAGEFIPKSLSVLSARGRFIEIGKNDVWDAKQVARLKPDISYFLVDLVRITQQQPDLIQSILCQLMQQFQAGSLKPLLYKVFSHDRVVDAFRYMQQAKHIGKIVVSQNSQIRNDSAYLITGGLSGIGLQVARWMVDRGARNLVLVGRSGASQAARETISQLEKAGARVDVVQADASNPEDVAQIIAFYQKIQSKIRRSPGSGSGSVRRLRQNRKSKIQLRGIIHAAGILDDGVLIQQSWERFQQVMAPKVQGAWNLHLATQNYPLDFFVMFSSAASVVGCAGQGNYCAANAFLDVLAHYRRSLGLPGLSINWGSWSSVGMAARLADRDRDRLVQQGITAIQPEQGLQILEELLARDITQIGVLPIDWSAFLKQLPNDEAFSFFKEVMPASEEKIRQPSKFLQQLEAATTSDRNGLLIDCIRSHIAGILGIEPPESIDIDRGLTELGIDSLSSVELRNKLQTSLQCTLPSTLIFDYPTIAAIADYLDKKILSPTSSKVEREIKGEDRNSAITEIQRLSEEEAEAMLFDELKNLTEQQWLWNPRE
ncbi:polyketide synthase family protein [Pleurocapsa sp. PCC 7327]|uniref:type I polyketide synthase n=1 Tax=Pleurocapsa sp. PCC 7327 TaxID=118163 RepID=UPI00029FB261|nr:type I polyketide synthase [Pleurocapsa sp. PCC 7327]AFY78333.1 polyketide synthase family protein [Pleurocapsa sp. PCC 7327]